MPGSFTRANLAEAAFELAVRRAKSAQATKMMRCAAGGAAALPAAERAVLLRRVRDSRRVATANDARAQAAYRRGVSRRRRRER